MWFIWQSQLLSMWHKLHALTMELVGSVVKDVSVLRRMLFAAYLPQDVPHYWEIVASSCVRSSTSQC